MLLCTHPPCSLWWQLRLKFRNWYNLAASYPTLCDRAPRWNHSSLPLPHLSLKRVKSYWKILVSERWWWGTQSTVITNWRKKTPPWIEKLKVGQLAEWDNMCKSLKRKSAPLLRWVSSPPVLSATQSNIACLGNYKLHTIVSNRSFALCSHFTGCFMQWSIKHHSDDRSYISSCSPGSCPLVALCI